MLIFIKPQSKSRIKTFILRLYNRFLFFSNSNASVSKDDPNMLIYLEHEYNLKIREKFSLIDDEISEFLKQKSLYVDQIRKMLE